jgi:hypothetical protein
VAPAVFLINILINTRAGHSRCMLTHEVPFRLPISPCPIIFSACSNRHRLMVASAAQAEVLMLGWSTAEVRAISD